MPPKARARPLRVARLRPRRAGRHFAAAVGSLRSLVEEFAGGGVTVQSRFLKTVIQPDGGVQMIVASSLRDLSVTDQLAELDAHVSAVRQHLAPLAWMSELALTMRAAIATVAAGISAILLLVQIGSAGVLRLLLPQAIFATLTIFPGLVTGLLWRLIWWSLRRQMGAGGLGR